jgi:pimeloyl-ACP methyl ester carboxylesterase
VSPKAAKIIDWMRVPGPGGDANADAGPVLPCGIEQQFLDIARVRPLAHHIQQPVLASCDAHMGRIQEARELVERLRAITPVVIPDATHWLNPEHRAFYLEGLRLAAGEET